MEEKDITQKKSASKETSKEKATRERKERIERAEKITNDLVEQGYVREKATVGIVAANIFAILVMAPLMWLMWAGYDHFYPDTIMDVFEFDKLIFIYIIDFPLIVIHELIHGICMYTFNGHDKSTIDYGVHQMTPYCSCQAPLKKWQYYITLLAPTIVLCGILCAIAFTTGSLIAIGLALLMGLGGGGDFLITLLLLFKAHGKDIVVLDHPFECGCYYFKKEK